MKTFYIALGIFLFALTISIPVILPFFHSGYFPTHDGEWAVVRLTDMFRTLRDFQIPARYSGTLNFGYGYPLFNFAYPSPYYLGVLMHFLGFGFVNTIKILFSGSVVFSTFFMFLVSKSLWKNTWAGIVSSILYIYFPYRMVDLYVRGSIGESLSFVLFPLLFYLAIKLTGKYSFLLVGGIAVSVASLIMTHNIMAVLFMPLYIIFILIQVILTNKKAIKTFLLSIFLGFGLSAFFWIPALIEKNNILLSQIPIADRSLYFVTLEQLIFPRWGYGVPIDPNGFSYQLGLTHLSVFFMAIAFLVFVFIKNKKGLKEHSIKIASLLIVATSLFAFLLFKPSEFLWKNIPFLSEINYPWTMLAPIGFLISLLSGFLASKAGLIRYLLLILSVISIFLFLPYARPQFYFDKGDNFYLTNDATTTSSDELMPLWVRSKPTQRWENKVEMITGADSIQNIAFTSKKIAFDVDVKNDTKIRVNTIYYPGWKVFVDGQVVSIDYKNEKGVMDIFIQSGKHDVAFVFGETSLRFFADILSIFSFLTLLGYGLFKTRVRLVKGL